MMVFQLENLTNELTHKACDTTGVCGNSHNNCYEIDIGQTGGYFTARINEHYKLKFSRTDNGLNCTCG